MIKVKSFERRGARLEMTPMMDLMFTLLVFFIYSMLSMTIHHGVPLTLPDAKSSTQKGLEACCEAQDRRVAGPIREAGLARVEGRCVLAGESREATCRTRPWLR